MIYFSGVDYKKEVFLQIFSRFQFCIIYELQSFSESSPRVFKRYSTKQQLIFCQWNYKTPIDVFDYSEPQLHPQTSFFQTYRGFGTIISVTFRRFLCFKCCLGKPCRKLENMVTTFYKRTST